MVREGRRRGPFIVFAWLLCIAVPSAAACPLLLLHAEEAASKIRDLKPTLSPISDLSVPPAFLIDEFPVNEDRWFRWMSRKAEGRTNSAYFQNARAALEFFDDWFRNGRGENFESMLDRMHEVSAIGDGIRGAPYSASTIPGGAAYSTSGIFPGLSRYGFEAMGEANVVKALRERSTPAFKRHSIPHQAIPIAWSSWNQRKMTFGLEIMIDKSEIAKATDPYLETAYRKPPRYRHPAKKVSLRGTVSGETYSVEIDVPAGDGSFSLGSIAWPTDVALDPKLIAGMGPEELRKILPANRLASRIKHTAPPASALPLYFETGRRLIGKLRRAFDEPVGDSEYLETLADYYHVMINAHPYFRVNSSMLMNQVNYLLRMRGFSPVTHGALDYWANFLGAREFRRLFRAHLVEQAILR